MKEISPKVSVVLPVYNPGPGVEKCIDSLRGQTLKDIEMIFVDDLGTDDSMDKIRAAAAQDARVRILTNEKNLGQGPSRNAGIEAARGEYLSFVDPDDFVAPDFLELLYQKAHGEDLDIVKGSAAIFHEGDDPLALQPNTKARDYILKGLEEGQPLYLLFSWEHWTGLYRRAFLMRSGARYGTSRNAQDITFLLRACYAAKTFALEERALYYYVMREDSAVHRYNYQRFENELCALREQLASLAEHPADDMYIYEYAYSRILMALRHQIRLSNIAGMEEKSEQFLDDLRAEVFRFPFLYELAQNHIEIFALTLCRVNLAPVWSARTWETSEMMRTDYIKILSNWVAFALAHPELKSRYKNEIKEKFSNALFFFTDEMAKKGPSPELDKFYRAVMAQRARLKEGKA